MKTQEVTYEWCLEHAPADVLARWESYRNCYEPERAEQLLIEDTIDYLAQGETP